MKLNLRVIGSFCIQEPFALRKVYGMTVLIFGYIILETHEFFQLFWINAGYPASLIIRKGSEFTGSAVFMEKSILNYLKLQFAHASNNLLITTKLSEQLRYAFIC